MRESSLRSEENERIGSKLTNCENEQRVQEADDVSRDTRVVSQNVEGNRRMFREAFEVDEKNDSCETENERNEGVERRPRVRDTSPGQSEDCGSRRGDEEQVATE